MSGIRRYDDQETARILRRAMELKAPVLPRVDELARRDGITLDQLLEAAGEAGIEVESVRRAAAELEAPEALRSSTFYGAPTRIVEERRIRRLVDPAEFDAFVDEVRSAFGIGGAATVTARGVTWSSGSGSAGALQGRQLTVSLVIREAGTILRVEEDLTPETVLVGVGAVAGTVGGFLGGLFLLSVLAPPAVVLAPLIPLASWGGTRRLYQREYRRHHDELIRIADRLAGLAEEPIK